MERHGIVAGDRGGPPPERAQAQGVWQRPARGPKSRRRWRRLTARTGIIHQHNGRERFFIAFRFNGLRDYASASRGTVPNWAVGAGLGWTVQSGWTRDNPKSSVAGCPWVQCTEISSLDSTTCPVGNGGFGTMPSDYPSATRNLKPYQEFARSVRVCSLRRRTFRLFSRHT
jgi:hypothetical protein